ncbi:ATP-binding cassette domain-containing protein [Paenibacillus sp. GCM10027627]|uniref:ABC transporter ATP-binding protein n=1 Tax=unclassified Paenibacillus TaxID=185978 RepID=UPI0036442556
MAELLQVAQLVKTFKATLAVKGVSFTIEEGKCVALLGPNGAGKTTTIRMLTGMLKPTSGTIRFQGFGEGEDWKSMLGYLPQSPSFPPWMTGFEYVVYAGKLCGLSGADAKAGAKKLLERVGLTESAGRRIGGYSGGMKQRLGLAQALIHGPRLLVMDEPVSALDPLGRREVLGLLKELRRETTVLFSTHVLHDAEELCDDVVIMRSGEVALQGSLQQIRSDYREPVIELRLEPSFKAAAWVKKWTDEPGAPFDKATFQNDVLRLEAADLETTRQWLIEELAREKIAFSRIEAGYTSLEDLFMKVVGA